MFIVHRIKFNQSLTVVCDTAITERISEVCRHDPTTSTLGLVLSKIVPFLVQVYLKMEVRTFITAYSAVDIPGLWA